MALCHRVYSFPRQPDIFYKTGLGLNLPRSFQESDKSTPKSKRRFQDSKYHQPHTDTEILPRVLDRKLKWGILAETFVLVYYSKYFVGIRVS